MKRKINLVGQNTLTVSLPTKWAQLHNLKKGDDIELIEENDMLIISKDYNPPTKEIEIDISKYGTMAGRVLGALYKAGYDRIKLLYDSPEKLAIIQKEMLKGFIGIDMIHHAKDYCILESMAAVQPEELDNAMRRVFRLLIENANEAAEALKKKDFSGLESVAAKDININKFADFSRRLLNKFGYKQKDKTSMIYFIVEDLENIGDDYRDLARFISRNKIVPSNKIISIYDKVNSFLELFYTLFYDFREERYSAFGEQYQKLIKEIDSQCKNSDKQEIVILARLQGIVTSIFDLNGPLVTLKF